MSAGAREGQTFAGESLLVRYVNLVKLPHTLFAFPFALLGVLAASKVAAGHRPHGRACGHCIFSGAVGGDGVQPDSRPAIRRPQPTDEEPGASRGALSPGAGMGLGGGGGSVVRSRFGVAQSALPGAESRWHWDGF